MIKILSEKKERGKQFESLLKMILSKQGYGKIESNIHTTGTEIDLEGQDNVSASKIRVEAKAHKMPIDTPELKKFVLTATNDIKKGLIDYAVFWSLSRINSTAKHYFENNLDESLKNHITIKSDTELQQILTDIGIIGNEGSIDNNAKQLTKKNILERDLIYYQNQWYFIQYCSQTQTPSHFFILDVFGNPVEDIICKEIRIQGENLDELELILLNTKNRILEFMLQEDFLTLNDIVLGLKETKIDIQSTIEELKEQGLVVEENSKYFLSKEISAFLIICKEFLKNKKIIFMKSNYFTKTMNQQIIEYIKTRWALKLSANDNKLIFKMCLVSPSGLEYSLFESSTAIQNLREQCNDQIPTQTLKIIKSDYFTKMAILVLTDIHHNGTLGLQKLRGALIDIKIRIATEDELFFKIHTIAPLLTMKVKGSVKKGQMLSPENPEVFLDTSRIMYNLGDVKKAIKEIDHALQIFPNEGDWLQAAYINKGLYLTEIGKLTDAEELLDNATKLFPKQEQGWLNLGNLYLVQNKIEQAENCFRQASSLKPDYVYSKYGLARIAILKGNKKSCLELLEEVFKMEKRFVTRIQLDKEFRCLKKSREYTELLKKLRLPKRL